MSERNLFLKGKKSLLAAVRGLLLLCALGCVPVLRAQVPTIHQDAVIGAGQTFLWRCQQLTASGPQEEVVKKVNTDIDSIRYTLSLEVLDAADVPVENLTICKGDTLLWRCQLVYEEDDYADTVKYVRYPQVDSIRYSMHLTVNTPIVVPVSETIDEGDTLIWRCLKVYESGVYDDTVYSGTPMCAETIHRLTLTVTPRPTEDKPAEEASICAGQTFLWRCMQLTAADTYHDTIKYAGSNVDSVRYTLNLTVNEAVMADPEEATIYEGETFLWRCLQLTAADTYHDTVFAAGGCPETIYTMVLTVVPHAEPIEIEQDIAICKGDTVLWRCRLLTESDTYRDTVRYAPDYDSARYTLHLTVRSKIVKPNDQVLINKGDSTLWHGQWYKNAGEYTLVEPYPTAPYCDSVEYRLRVVTYDSVVHYACGPDTLLWRCNLVTETGHYKETVHYTNSQFTDAHVDSAYYVLQFESYPDAARDTTYAVINERDLPYVWNDSNLTATGIYHDSVFSMYQECPDEIHSLHLTVVLNDSDVFHSCQGDTLLWRCQLLGEDGIYRDTLRREGLINGEVVDSIIYVMDFKFLNISKDSTLDLTLSADALPYAWREQSLTEAGTYYDTVFHAASYCPDSLFTLNLTVQEIDTVILHDTLCYGDTLLWRCMLLDSTDVYYDADKYESGNDSVRYQMHLTVQKPDPVVRLTEQTLCNGDSIQWVDGKYYKQTIDTTMWSYYPLTQAQIAQGEEHGCDSVLYRLKLTARAVLDSTFTDSICATEVYMWRNKPCSIPTTDVVDATYTFYDTAHYIGTTDCDSVRYTMNVTVLRPTYQTTDTIVCEQDLINFSWKPFENDNNHYEFSTDADMTVTAYHRDPIGRSQAICDSVIHRLRLVVHRLAPDTLFTRDTVCHNETYLWYGDPYTATGHYEHTVKWANSTCDSAYCVLDLVVLDAADTVRSETKVCQGFEPFAWQGQTIDHAGIYLDSILYEGTQCVQHYLKHEVIELVTKYDTLEATVCPKHPFEWEYAEQAISDTGWYYHAVPYAQNAQCDTLIHCLHLTAQEVTEQSETRYICNGESITWFDQVLTEAGVYGHADTAENGCEVVRYTLTLVKQEAAETERMTLYLCDGASKTWKGRTYDHAGTYEYVIQSAQGCDSVKVIVIVEEQTSVTADPESAVIYEGQIFTWHGENYTEAGEYNAKDTFASGCDSAYYTLQLTVLPVSKEVTNITDTVCKGTDYMNTGHVINAHTEWTDSVRELDSQNALVDFITNYTIDVYSFDFPDGMLESAEIACGQAPKITTVVQSLHAYLESADDFAPNCQLSWFISENNGIWQPLDTMQALNGNDSIVTLRCVMTSECGTISKEASFQVGHKVYPETFTEYDFLPVIKKFEGELLMIDVNDICSHFGWTNCAPQLSTDAGYTATGLYPDQVHWYKQVGQIDNLSHPDPSDPKDENMQTYGYYYRPLTNDAYYAIIEHELTVSVSDCDAWARTVALSGNGSGLGDLQPNVVNGQQRPVVIVKGVTSCDITVTNSMGSVVLSLTNAPGSFTAPSTPGTYFVVIRDLSTGAVFNRTLLVY